MSQRDKDRKTAQMRIAVKERVKKEEYAFRLVEKMVLLDCVDKEFFLNAGAHITVSQYTDVTEERSISKLCGYPLCSNRLTQVLKQKYKISVREKKVYDISERKNFCSNKCYKASKYFQMQLSSETIWMKDKTQLLELKLLDDAENQSQKLSGTGEEIVMNTSEDEGLDVDHESFDVEHENVVGEQIDDEHEHVVDEHEHVDDEHEHVDDEHEHVDDEHEHVVDEHEHVVDEHEYGDNNEDFDCIIERCGNVEIDLGINLIDSDDDDDSTIDDIDDIDDGECGDSVKNDDFIKNTKNYSESDIHDDFKNTKAKIISGNDQEQTNSDKRSEVTGQNPHGRTGGNWEGAKSDKTGLAARLQCVEKVHEVLREWCSTETREYIKKSLRTEDSGTRHEEKRECKDEVRNKQKHNAKSVMLPSIDSKSQMAIRGNIVSDKLRKAISPMLSKLGLTMADISSQLTSILKTFRFTNTNIVLKPIEWTLMALVLLLVLAKYNPSLTGLLSSRQRGLHLLLSNTLDDEDEIDRLLAVFNFDEVPRSEPEVTDGQQSFDMEELD